MSPFETQVAAAREWFAHARFDGIVRLHTAREVAAQQGTIQPDYTVARTAAEAFYLRLRELFAAGRADHDVRPLLTRPGGRDEADGARGHLPGRVGDLGERVDVGGPGSGPCELSARARFPTRRPAWFARS